MKPIATPIELKRARCYECGKRSYKLIAARITLMSVANGVVTRPLIALCPKHIVS